MFAVFLVFVYHLAEAGVDPTAIPKPHPISSSCPRPLFSCNCYPPNILSEDDSTSFPSKREVPQLPRVYKGPGKEPWGGRVAEMVLRRKVKRPGPCWSQADLWLKLKVMGTLSRLWTEKCYFLAYVWWYHTGCSTKNEDARRDQRQTVDPFGGQLSNPGERGWWLSLVPSVYPVACCMYSLECPTDNVKSLNPE